MNDFRFKFFDEIPPWQDKWIVLEGRLTSISSIDEAVDWNDLNIKAGDLLEASMSMLRGFTEECKNAPAFPYKSEVIKQSAIYLDCVNRCSVKLAEITNRLYQMTNDPTSWTFRGFLSEMEKYRSIREEYDVEGRQLKVVCDKASE